jgi:hypothetical protein
MAIRAERKACAKAGISCELHNAAIGVERKPTNRIGRYRPLDGLVTRSNSASEVVPSVNLIAPRRSAGCELWRACTPPAARACRRGRGIRRLKDSSISMSS